MSAFRPDTAAEYRQQAETIRSLAAQISLLEAKLHLLEAARARGSLGLGGAGGGG